ncbi:HEAT repeat domain-containing protein, partial [Planctomycetota bacterium]
SAVSADAVLLEDGRRLSGRVVQESEADVSLELARGVIKLTAKLPRAEVRAVVREFGSVGASADAEAQVRLLIQQLASKKAQERADAVVQLGAFGVEADTAVPPLLRLIADDNERVGVLVFRGRSRLNLTSWTDIPGTVGYYVVRVLGDIRDRRAVAPLLAVVGNDRLRTDTMMLKRIEAAKSLALMKERRALDVLARLLRDDQDPIQAGVVVPLAMFGELAAEPLVRELTLGSQSSSDLAANALMRLGAPAVPQLVELLRAKDGEVRERVSRCLARMIDPGAIAPLAEVTRDPVAKIRRHALATLRDLFSNALTAVSHTRQGFKGSATLAPSNAEFRILLAEFDGAAAPLLVEALSDLQLRAGAFALLWGLVDIVARERDMAVGDDKAQLTRLLRSIALKTVPHFVESLRFPDEDERKRAEDALSRATGERLGRDPNAWERWWEKNEPSFRTAVESPADATEGATVEGGDQPKPAGDEAREGDSQQQGAGTPKARATSAQVEKEEKVASRLVERWLKLRAHVVCQTCETKGKLVCKKCGGEGKYYAKRLRGPSGWRTCDKCRGSGHHICKGCGGAGYDVGVLGKLTYESLHKSVRGRRSKSKHIKALLRVRITGEGKTEADKTLHDHLSWAFIPVLSYEGIAIELSDDLQGASVRYAIRTPDGKVGSESLELAKMADKWYLAPPPGWKSGK